MYQHLVFIDGEEKKDIVSCYYNRSTNRYEVEFKNSPKVYSYPSHRVHTYELQHELSPSDYRVYSRGKPFFSVEKILIYGHKTKVYFKDVAPRTYDTSTLSFEYNSLAQPQNQDCLDYLRQTAVYTSVETDEGKKLLVEQYNKLDFVEERTVLSNYLSGRPGKQISDKPLPLIFPFGLNASQYIATQKAFAEQISVIEGPPGTGKTQTILNIIANAVVQGKTVAIVSGNNAATANVVEKLDKQGMAFITAFLGNATNKAAFIQGQTGSYPWMRDWRLPPKQYEELHTSVSALSTELEERLHQRNRIAQLKTELSDLATEVWYFEQYLEDIAYEGSDGRAYIRRDANKILQLWLSYETLVAEERLPSRWFKLKSMLFYGVKSMRLFDMEPNQAIATLQVAYYAAKQAELSKELAKLEKQLERYHFDEKMEQLKQESMALFKSALVMRYGSQGGKRPVFSDDDLWKQGETVVKEYPVILSTTHALRSSLRNVVYDFVIIDEASQVDVVTGALALSCAKQAVIVGDQMQLSHVVKDDVRRQTEAVWQRFRLNPAYNYANNSLLASVARLWPDTEPTLLREHYRCHPKIINFCNRKFYRGDLIVMTEDHGEDDVMILHKTAMGQHARGRINQRQIDVAIAEAIPTLGAVSGDSIGIISPYRDQADLMDAQTQGSGYAIDTVHKFQGREKENILITTVDNVIRQFVDNPNMLNVAVSRAVRRLRVIVSPDERNKNTNVGDLMRYIEYNNFDVQESQVRSIFDLLYRQYKAQRAAFLLRRKKVSRYDSENLAHAMLEDILKDEAYKKLDFTIHQKLRVLLADKLTEAERRYASHHNTHVDFVIFNRMDKQPVLVVEVDGTRFHAEGSDQARRDAMKDSILKKYGISILRLRTDESREEMRIKQKLDELLSVEATSYTLQTV